MDTKEFVIWLKGFTDRSSNPPTPEDWDKIRHELALVFNKITPYRPNTEPDPISFYNEPTYCHKSNFDIPQGEVLDCSVHNFAVSC